MVVDTIVDVYWELAGTLRERHATLLTPSHVLYMLSGSHLVYGQKALLYIGKTTKIAARLAKHQQLWGKDEPGEITVAVASVGEFIDWETWQGDRRARYDTVPDEARLRQLEALLLYCHQPAYNSLALARVPSLTTAHIRLFNTGAYAPLLPEVSSRRWADSPRSRIAVPEGEE